MNTLFIDTSSNTLTVALLSSDKVISKRGIDSINEHSKYAVSEIEHMFSNCDINPKNIHKIMVINGPGSFTGLRIGVTIAKTYAWSLNINVIPISTLKAYALSNTQYDYYVCVMNARRGYVYAGIYDEKYTEYLSDRYISIEELNSCVNSLKGKVVVIGDTAINGINEHLDIKLNIERIYAFYKNDDGINAHKLVPNYLKKVEAEEKLEGII